MTRLIPLAFLMIAVTSPSGLAADRESSRDTARKDLEKLQGTWTLVSMEVEGQPTPREDFQGWQAVYDGDALTLRSGETVRRRGIVTLEPTQRPRAINTWDQDGP